MTNNFPELHQLLTQTSQEYRHGLHEIIGASSGDSPSSLCEHLGFLRTGTAGAALGALGDYKQLVTDIADKVGIDWTSTLGGEAWTALPAEQIEAAIVQHVEADKIYIKDTPDALPDAMAALDHAFTSLSSDWRKLLAAVIYIHQVIRPSGKGELEAQEEPSGEDAKPNPGEQPELTTTPEDQLDLEEPADATTEDSPTLEQARRTGEEPWHSGSRALGPTLLDFWRWSASDLTSEATRGIVAEFIVCSALGLAGGVRTERDACDIVVYPAGLKIAVKSAAPLAFGSPQNPVENRFAIRSQRSRQNGANAPLVNLQRLSDIYVFCLLAHPEKATLDPLDVAQWEFYVVPSSVLDAQFPLGQSISLASLQTLDVPPITYEELESRIQQYVPVAAGKPTLIGRR